MLRLALALLTPCALRHGCTHRAFPSCFCLLCSTVYLGRWGGREVAVKMLRPGPAPAPAPQPAGPHKVTPMSATPPDEPTAAELLKSFKQEARLLTRLQQHPHIVALRHVQVRLCSFGPAFAGHAWSVRAAGRVAFGRLWRVGVRGLDCGCGGSGTQQRMSCTHCRPFLLLPSSASPCARWT